MLQPDAPPIATDGLPARSTGLWVFDKKHYFERYLAIFTRGIDRKWSGKLSYADLFCGPGRSIVRNSGEEVNGSPLLSLDYEFDHYVFVDVPEVLATLEKRLKDHPKQSKVRLVPGDCNKVIAKILEELPADHLTLAFIDPTGLQIMFSTIERLVHNRKVDMLMTIQLGMGIRLNLPQYIQTEGAALTDFLGNSRWREDCEAGGSPSQIARRIVDRYMAQIRKLDYGTVRDREIEIRTDETNLLLYFMVLASRHRRGEDFWRKATQIGPSGQRRLI
ncbi:MAG: three-Cys-motif partner protein TcmP [Candidatus Acidiferrum sp.]